MGLMAQLKGLFLQAVPTIFLVLIFYFFLRSQFFGPIERALEERARRTSGARHEADEAIAEAERAQAEYQAALRKARGEVYAEQEAERRKALEERAAAIRAARDKAAQFVRERKAGLDVEISAAKKQIEGESSSLGGEIARAVLAAPSGGGPRPGTAGTGGAR
jgi:F-type H+-transporting ATPase subunit b